METINVPYLSYFFFYNHEQTKILKLLIFKHFWGGVDNDEWDYLTLIPRESQGATFTIRPYGATDDFGAWLGMADYHFLPFSFRINNEDWVDVITPDGPETYFDITINYSDRVQLKCYSKDFEWGMEDTLLFHISSSDPYDVDGTPMSLIYEDEFKKDEDEIEL